MLIMEPNLKKKEKVEIKRKKFKLAFYLTLLLSLVIFIVDYFYSDYFMSKSRRLTVILQKLKIHNLMIILDVLIFKIIITVVFIFYIFSKHYLLSFGVLNMLCCNIYISSLLLFYFSDTMPMFHDPRILEIEGHCEYGKPTREVFTMAPLLVWIYQQLDRKFNLSMWIQILLGSGIFLVILLQMFIKIYLGLGSFNQVIMGFVFGLLLLEIQNKIDDKIKKYILLPIIEKDKLVNGKAIIYILSLFVLMNYSVIWLWSSKFSKFENLENQFFKFRNCIHCLAELENNFSTLVMQRALYFNLIFGIYLGVYLMPVKVYDFGRYMSDKRIKQVILRIIVYLAFLSPLLLTAYYHSSRPYVVFAKSLLSSLFVGYLISNPLLRVMKYVSEVPDELIIKRGDFLAIDEKDERELIASKNIDQNMRDFYV